MPEDIGRSSRRKAVLWYYMNVNTLGTGKNAYI